MKKKVEFLNNFCGIQKILNQFSLSESGVIRNILFLLHGLDPLQLSCLV